jgi:hypothetical protein
MKNTENATSSHDANSNITSAKPATPDSVTIHADAWGHRLISPSGDKKVKTGGNPEFTMSPEPGYHIDSLFVDSALVPTDDTYTFINVTANHSISVKFTYDVYTITAESGPNGTITPAGKISLPHGEHQSFMITPATGYHVEKVIVDDVDVSIVESYTFTNIGTNHNIRAEFAPDK